jgi:hypothetical protein
VGGRQGDEKSSVRRLLGFLRSVFFASSLHKSRLGGSRAAWGSACGPGCGAGIVGPLIR